MPELPEVETVRRSLQKKLVGRRIVRLYVHNPHLRTPIDKRALRRQVVGEQIVALGRRSKYLLLHLTRDKVLVLHLGMSGRLMVTAAGAPLEPHTHVRLGLDAEEELRFRDHRRFGMLFTVQSSRLEQHPRFAHLGPEPFDEGFSLAYLSERARGVRKPIKNFLMDASVVVGVGNIYASEALFRAGVHPKTAAGRLRPARWQRLHAAVQATLREAVVAGGTTINDFHDAEGQAGEFQVKLQVYGRAGEACPRCGRTIKRIVQQGRSSFYCPGCQH